MAAYPRADTDGVSAQPDFPQLELRALAYWSSHGTFGKSLDLRQNDTEFVFYDGPPFANGLPHYGHLLTGYAKDIVPRYKTMRGFRVDRRFGWDTHGLPAEVEAERLLGISGKADILKMGIETFNEACRDSVLRYTREWQEYVTRQARWVDFGNDYKTLDLTTEDGTGVVHMAPAYGEADAAACQTAGIPIVLTVDEQGKYLPMIHDWAGVHVFKANKPIIARAAAPLLPMTAETIWHGLTGGDSVHLAGWPPNESLAQTMDLTRSVCSAAEPAQEPTAAGAAAAVHPDGGRRRKRSPSSPTSSRTRSTSRTWS